MIHVAWVQHNDFCTWVKVLGWRGGGWPPGLWRPWNPRQLFGDLPRNVCPGWQDFHFCVTRLGNDADRGNYCRQYFDAYQTFFRDWLSFYFFAALLHVGDRGNYRQRCFDACQTLFQDCSGLFRGPLAWRWPGELPPAVFWCMPDPLSGLLGLISRPSCMTLTGRITASGVLMHAWPSSRTARAYFAAILHVDDRGNYHRRCFEACQTLFGTAQAYFAALLHDAERVNYRRRCFDACQTFFRDWSGLFRGHLACRWPGEYRHWCLDACQTLFRDCSGLFCGPLARRWPGELSPAVFRLHRLAWFAVLFSRRDCLHPDAMDIWGTGIDSVYFSTGLLLFWRHLQLTLFYGEDLWNAISGRTDSF